jgi:hypothetical protein
MQRRLQSLSSWRLQELDAIFDDNYFDLSAGYEKRVLLQKGNIFGNVSLRNKRAVKSKKPCG